MIDHSSQPVLARNFRVTVCDELKVAVTADTPNGETASEGFV